MATSSIDPNLREEAETYRRALADAGGQEHTSMKPSNVGALSYGALYVSPAYSLHVASLSVPRLAVNMMAGSVHGGFDRDRSRTFLCRRHSLFLTPAGYPVTWTKQAPSRHLGIYFQPNIVDGSDGDVPLFGTVPALFNAMVPGIGRLVDQFAEELRTPGILNLEAADCLARLVLIRLSRHLQRTVVVSHRLTPKVITRLRDYVDAHLREPILVADLANQAGQSPSHFAKSFTEQTGQSPHKFVMTLRIERAAELLARSDSSLADIAYECGFASQQHMCTVLRRCLGMTPSRFRAQKRLRSREMQAETITDERWRPASHLTIEQTATG
jgi:AraC-like DNA-binding protein